MQDALVAEEALAEIEAQIAADHLQEAGEGRLVEAEHLADVGDDMRVQSARAAIAAGRGALGAAARHARHRLAVPA